MKSFVNAFKNLTFKGRVSLDEYWKFVGIMVLIYFILFFATIFLEILFNTYIGGNAILFIYCIVVSPAAFTMQVKRLHDTDKSGDWIWLNLLPIIGSIIVFIVLCKEGDAEVNTYGETPKKFTSPDTSVYDKTISPLAEVCNMKKEDISVEKTIDINADISITNTTDKETSQSKNSVIEREVVESKIVENESQENKKEETNNIPKNTNPHKRIAFFPIIIAIFLAISVGTNIFQKKDNAQLKSNIEYYKERLKEKDDTISNLKNDVHSMKNELDFYENNAVIVTIDGEKYHKYNCQYILGKNYYIYNIEAAEYYGYEPCDICFNNNEDDHIKTKFEEDLDRIKEKVSS